MRDITNTWKPNSQNDVFHVGQKSLGWRVETGHSGIILTLSSPTAQQRDSKQLPALCSLLDTLDFTYICHLN